MPPSLPCPSCGAPIAAGVGCCEKCGHSITGPTLRLSAEELALATPATARRSVDTGEFFTLIADVTETLAPRFQNVRLHGHGGMGLVFLARDPGLKRDVAVKVLLPDAAADDNARKRFVREAQAAAAVTHPNVVTVYQVGELRATGAPYFVMQFVDGQTLEQAFPRGAPVPEPTARRIVAEIAAALAAAHDRNVVHRDIKPSNVMIDPGSGRAIVVDFGISAATSRQPGEQNTRLTAQGVSVGTPQYMSPEQAAGDDVTGKSDVYSMGLVAFELLTGRPVFEEKNVMALIAAHINGQPPRLSELRPELDPAFADVVQRCLAKKADERPTAPEVMQLLQPVYPTIEWPPPGLEQLHRVGLQLLHRARVLALTALALMALLYLQPMMTTGRWSAGETSWFWRVVWAPGFVADDMLIRPIECGMLASVDRACAARLVDAGPLWLFAIALLVLLLFYGLFVLIKGTVTLRRETLRGAKLGYPPPVLTDVAWDSGEDTGALLEGIGPFALTSEQLRADLLRRRRSAALWLLGGYTITAFVPLFWVLGAIHVGDSGGRIASLPEVLIALVPLLVVHAWSARLLASERVLRHRWRRTAGRAPTGATVQPQLVASWLKSARQLLTDDRRTQRALRPVVIAQVVGSLLLVFAAMVLMAGAINSALWNGPTVRRMQQDWIDNAEGRQPNSWAWLDSTLAGEIQREANTVDRGRVVPRTPRPSAALRRAIATRADGAAPTDSAIEALSRDTVWGWRTSWAEKLIAAKWTSRDSTVPALTVFNHVDPGSRNARIAALLAWEAGDVGTALARDRESLEFARYALAIWGWLPYQSLVDVFEALDFHLALAAERGDSLGVRTAQLLEARFARYIIASRLFSVGPLPLTLTLDPDDGRAVRYARRSAGMSPGMRRQLALVTVLGGCLNTRESLFGPTEARWALVEQMRSVVADMPVVLRQLDTLAAKVRAQADRAPGAFGVVERANTMCSTKSWSLQD